eukprot:3126495-Rhodomonas_salina.2
MLLVRADDLVMRLTSEVSSPNLRQRRSGISESKRAVLFDHGRLAPGATASTNMLKNDSHPHELVLRIELAKQYVDAVSSGWDMAPLLYQHHYLHEAGIFFLRHHTSSFATDAAIRDLRATFLVTLKEDFGVQLNVSEYQDMHLENQIDLGGGNTIAPYE